MKRIWEIVKKIFKHKVLLVLIVVIVIGAVLLLGNVFKKNPVVYVTEKVKKGDLTQTISETGVLQAASEINLNFKGSGTITEMAVAKGADVKKGDVLARLDAGQLEIQVRQAEANLAMAQANLDRFVAGAKPEERKVSEESVNNAKIAYANAKIDHENLLAKLELDVQKNSNQAIINSRDNLVTSLESSLTLMDHSFDVIKNIKDKPSFGTYFSISNQQVKNDFNAKYDYLYIDVEAAKASYNQAKASLDENEINTAYVKVTAVLEKLRDVLDTFFLGLNATVTTADFAQPLLDTYIASVKLEQNTTNTSISALAGANQAYINAKNNLEVVLSTKDMQIASSQAQVDNALGAYNLAKAQYELTIAPARAVDIAYYQAQVAQAQAAYELSLINLDDYIIYAPIDGKIVFANYDIGEQVGMGLGASSASSKPVFTLNSQGDFEIEVDIPEADIVKVKIGNPAKITLDAYGDEVKFSGSLVAIDLASTNIQDVVYYKAKVALDKTDKEIKSGMTANVDILTAEKKDVLYVPTRSVKDRLDGSKYVQVQTATGVIEKTVVIGLRADQGIELISGLQENEDVVTYKK